VERNRKAGQNPPRVVAPTEEEVVVYKSVQKFQRVVVVVFYVVVTQSFGFVYCVIAGADEDLLLLMCPTEQAPVVLFA
jgi:hypothetical protein